MKIIINDVQKKSEFRDIEVGAIFRCFDNNETLYMKIEDLNIYKWGNNYLYNAINLETFEIEEIQDFVKVIVFEKSFLTVK